MATVKFTYTVEQQVRNKIQKAFESRFKTARDAWNGVLSAENVLDAYIESTGGHALYEASKHWLTDTSSSRVGDINGIYLGQWLYFTNSNGNHINKKCPKMPHDFEGKEFEGIAEKLKIAKENLNKIQSEYNATEMSILKAFRAYGSVNTAIKEHPELANMLPSSVIDKINQKVTKPKASEVEVEIDAGMVNTVAVLAKFAESA